MPHKPTGVTGTPLACASRAVPDLPAIGSRSSEIVPSGNTVTHSPARSASTAATSDDGRVLRAPLAPGSGAPRAAPSRGRTCRTARPWRETGPDDRVDRPTTRASADRGTRRGCSRGSPDPRAGCGRRPRSSTSVPTAGRDRTLPWPGSTGVPRPVAYAAHASVFVVASRGRRRDPGAIVHARQVAARRRVRNRLVGDDRARRIRAQARRSGRRRRGPAPHRRRHERARSRRMGARTEPVRRRRRRIARRGRRRRTHVGRGAGLRARRRGARRPSRHRLARLRRGRRRRPGRGDRPLPPRRRDPGALGAGRRGVRVLVRPRFVRPPLRGGPARRTRAPGRRRRRTGLRRRRARRPRDPARPRPRRPDR